LSLICFEDVSFIYPGSKNAALCDITLSIEEGEFFGVMGENTSGKTTFCKLINGINPLLSGGELYGAVHIDGMLTSASSVSELALNVGMVLDDPDAQIFTSAVFNEAAFALENILLSPDEIKERVDFALRAAGLSGFEKRLPGTLSGGEKQRLAIAAALAMKGKILVLDEPLCRLDPGGAQEVMEVLKDLREQKKMTIVMASHDSAMMAEYADRVCILKDGKIAALDTPGKIFANNDLLHQTGLQPINKEEEKKNLTTEYCNQGCLENTEKGEELEHKLRDFRGFSSCIIEIKNLSFKYPNGIGIENLNLTVEENDFIALIGNNGCGKTTLIKNIAGLLRPSSGEIFINGKNTRKLKTCDISREIGFVMQNPDTQLFTDSVYKDVSFALKNMRLPKNEIKKRVMEALEIVGLQNEADTFSHALSRSERTKTVIACVLAMGTKTLIFDEIDAGNDYNGNIKVMNIVKELHEKGFTIIFITHNMFLADRYAHRIIKMDRKGIVFDERHN